MPPQQRWESEINKSDVLSDLVLNETDSQRGLSGERSKVSLCKSACLDKTDTGSTPEQNMQRGAHCVPCAAGEITQWAEGDQRPVEEMEEQGEDEGAQSGNMLAFAGER